MIRRLLVKDPNKRLTAEEAYNHAWIKSVDDRLLSQDAIKNMRAFVAEEHFRKSLSNLSCLASSLPTKNIEEIKYLFR